MLALYEFCKPQDVGIHWVAVKIPIGVPALTKPGTSMSWPSCRVTTAAEELHTDACVGGGRACTPHSPGRRQRE